MIKFFTWRYFAFFSHRWKHGVSMVLLPCYCFAVIAVFFYCGVECAFASHVKSELGSGTFNFGYRLAESRETWHVPVLGDGVKSFQLGKDSASENRSGLVKSGFSVCHSGEMESNPSKCQCSGNSEKPQLMRCEDNSKKVHFSVALFCCFVCFWCGWGFKSEFS